MDSEHAAGIIANMDRRHVGPPSPRCEQDRDNLVVLRGVSWAQYQAIVRAREKASPKLAYLDGVLEVVTKSFRHEFAKKFIARLLEMYAVECDVELIAAGETTWGSKTKQAGAEADECYFIDKVRSRPDLALEVVLTSGGIDKLEIYRRLRVREVWFWIESRFWLYALVDGIYQEIRASRVLAGIDLDELARIVLTTDDDEQTAAVRTYRDALRRRT